jgi:hypothetical protein
MSQREQKQCARICFAIAVSGEILRSYFRATSTYSLLVFARSDGVKTSGTLSAANASAQFGSRRLYGFCSHAPSVKVKGDFYDPLIANPRLRDSCV